MARRKSGLAGVSKLRRKLRRLPDQLIEPIKQEMIDSAEELRFDMLGEVPVDEGDLAAAIEVKMSRDKLAARIGPGTRTKKARAKVGWRAHFTVFGTIYQPANNFIGRAYLGFRGGFIRRINRRVNIALRKASDL